jgi:hypothetical protein
MWGEDNFTSTVEGAAAHAAGLGDWDDDRPSAADLAEDDAPAVVAAGGIRCAHCKARHATVADVRWCGGLEAEARAEAEAEAAWEAAADVAYARDREAIAERGTWFGPQTEADTWG